MKSNFESVDQYISTVPPSTRKILRELRSAIREAAPAATEKISYQMPTYFQNGNLVHFAAYKNHIGFYPAPSGILAFKDELIGLKSSKGAVQFPIDQPLPLKLIGKIVRFRVKENTLKAPKKKPAK